MSASVSAPPDSQTVWTSSASPGCVFRPRRDSLLGITKPTLYAYVRQAKE